MRLPNPRKAHADLSLSTTNLYAFFICDGLFFASLQTPDLKNAR
jgi:hypothetical protein